MARTPKVLWIIDPVATLDQTRDTTLHLARAMQKLGIKTALAEARGLHWNQGALWVDTIDPQTLAPLKRELTAHWDQIHYRVDPPVHVPYLAPLGLLQAAGLGQRVTNPIELISSESEKLFALRQKNLAPLCVVSANREVLTHWGRAQGQGVLKPLNDAQSRGVKLLSWKTPELAKRAAQEIDSATQQGTQTVLLQEYLPQVQEGELRTWWIEGRCVGALRKWPLSGDFRVNIDRGSRVEGAQPSARQAKKMAGVKKLLKIHKIRLAAVDWVDEWVVDFNFTSPGLLIELEQRSNRPLALDAARALAKI